MFITYVRYGMRSISSKSMSTAADEGDDPPEGSSSALRLSVRQGLLDNARRIRHVGNHCFRGPLVDLEAFMLVGGPPELIFAGLQMVRVRILNEDFVRRLPARQQPNGARRERFSLCDAYALTPAGNQILTMRARHSGSTSAKRAEPPRHKIAVQINLRCNGQGKANKPKPGHPNCRRGCGGFGSCLQNCPEKDKPASRLPAGHACNFSATVTLTYQDVSDGTMTLSLHGQHVPSGAWIPLHPEQLNISNETKTRARDIMKLGATAAPVSSMLQAEQQQQSSSSSIQDIPVGELLTEFSPRATLPGIVWNSSYELRATIDGETGSKLHPIPASSPCDQAQVAVAHPALVPTSSELRSMRKYENRVQRIGASATSDWGAIDQFVRKILILRGHVIHYHPGASTRPPLLVFTDARVLEHAVENNGCMVLVDAKVDTNGDHDPLMVFMGSTLTGSRMPFMCTYSTSDCNQNTSTALMTWRGYVPCDSPDCSHPITTRHGQDGEYTASRDCAMDEHGHYRQFSRCFGTDKHWPTITACKVII